MNKTNDKTMCSFFASDYHFEMITIPYIEKELDKNKKIVILTEEDLTPTVNVLLSRMNLNQKKKDKILNINWNNDNVKKIKEIEKNKKENMVVFIKGKERYINETRNNLNMYLGNNNLECIDCYDINEIGNDLGRITKKYNQVLNTMGKSII